MLPVWFILWSLEGTCVPGTVLVSTSGTSTSIYTNQIRPNVWKLLRCSRFPSCRHHCCCYCCCHCCWGGRVFSSFSISFCFSTATLVFVPPNLPPPNVSSVRNSCSTHNHGRLSFYEDVPAVHHRPCWYCCRRLRWHCRRRL